MGPLLRWTSPLVYGKNLSINRLSCRPGVRPGRSGLRWAFVPGIARPALRGDVPAMAAPSHHLRPRRRPSVHQLDLPLDLPAPPQLIPLEEAQRWLGVSPETFARLLCAGQLPDRKSTRLNSSHLGISYAVFC